MKILSATIQLIHVTIIHYFMVLHNLDLILTSVIRVLFLEICS